ncbi:MAG: hypothetical protein QXP70_06150, partial [Methanomassiliicoccales archaeon]
MKGGKVPAEMEIVGNNEEISSLEALLANTVGEGHLLYIKRGRLLHLLAASNKGVENAGIIPYIEGGGEETGGVKTTEFEEAGNTFVL